MNPKDEAQRVLERIRLSIRQAGLSQRKVEERAGFSRGYLSQLLARNLDLKYWHLVAILNVLELSPGRFFSELYPEPHPTAALKAFRGASGRLSGELDRDLDRVYGRRPGAVQELRERLERCERAISELEAKGILDSRK